MTAHFESSPGDASLRNHQYLLANALTKAPLLGPAGRRPRMAIIMGDTNFEDEEEIHRAFDPEEFADAWTVSWPGENGYTFSRTYPPKVSALSSLDIFPLSHAN